MSLLQAIRQLGPSAGDALPVPHLEAVVARLRRGFIVFPPGGPPLHVAFSRPFELERAAGLVLERASARGPDAPGEAHLLDLVSEVTLETLARAHLGHRHTSANAEARAPLHLEPAPEAPPPLAEGEEAQQVVEQFLEAACDAEDRRLAALRFRDEHPLVEAAGLARRSRLGLWRWERRFLRRLLRFTAHLAPAEACRPRARRLVEAAFLGDPAPGLWTHLSACRACRGHHDRLGWLARALGPGRSLSHAAERRIAERLGATPEPPSPSRGARWLAAATAGTASAGLVFTLAGTMQPSASLEGSPNSAGPAALFMCLEGDGSGSVLVRSSARAAPLGQDPPELRCSDTGRVQLLYATPEGGPRFLVAFGRNEAGEVFWYAPRSPDAPAEALEPGERDHPLALDLHLASAAPAERLELVVRFLDMPLPAELARLIESDVTDLEAVLVVRTTGPLEALR